MKLSKRSVAILKMFNLRITWQLHYSLSPDKWRERIFYFEWYTVNCPGYAHFKLFRFLLIRKTDYIQAIIAMQCILCESKIQQRISPLSDRLNLDFYKHEEKTWTGFFGFSRLNLSILNFRKAYLTQIYWMLDLKSANLKIYLVYTFIVVNSHTFSDSLLSLKDFK